MAYHPNNQQQYSDPSDAFNPYDSHQQHPTYDQGAGPEYNYGNGGAQRYTDDELAYNPHSPPAAGPAAGGRQRDSMGSQFDNETEDDHTRSRSKEGKSFKAYRYEGQEGIWTRGGGCRCFGRFFCCTLMIVIFLVLSIIFSLVLWVKPPSVTIGTVTPQSANGQVYNINSTGIDVNLGVAIAVENPNFFAVSIKHLKLEIFYPINNTALGTGEKDNINIGANQPTNFTFPFALQYKTADDPSKAVLTDLASKCVGGQDLKVNYKITVGLHIVVAVVSPVISNSFSFPCPVSASDIEGLISGGSF